MITTAVDDATKAQKLCRVRTEVSVTYHTIMLADVCLDKRKLSNKPEIMLIGGCDDEDEKSNR